MHTQKYLAETAEKQSVRAYAAAILQRTCKEKKPRAQAHTPPLRGGFFSLFLVLYVSFISLEECIWLMRN